jgi:hypothetical protein
MEGQLAQGNIGAVGEYVAEFKGGKLVLKAGAKPVEGVMAAMSVEVEAKVIFAAIKAAIPGQVDDAILGVIEAALVGA